MKNSSLGMLTFAAGCMVTVVFVMLMGSASSPQQSPRYHADFDTILGGIGGLTVEVTDHEEQKAYLYVISPVEEDEKGTPPTPRLIATVNLKSAGQEALEADLDAFVKD